MPVTGIYFISEPHAATAANILTDRLSKRHQPILLGKWSLEHRLLRETAPPPAPSSGSGTTSPAAPQQQQQQQQQKQQQQQSQQSQQQVRFMQWLDLSYHPTKLFVYTPSPRVMATLDREFEILVRVKMSGLWTLIKTMRAEGLVYEVEDFRVRVANVVQGGGGEAVKGVLVEVEYVPCAHLEGAEGVLRSFVEGLGVAGGRFVFAEEGVEAGKEWSVLDTARQYCEALRLR